MPRSSRFRFRASFAHPRAVGRVVVLLSLWATSTGLMANGGASPAYQPRPEVAKPQRTVVDGRFRKDTISVKFRDGLNIHLQGGVLTDSGTQVLAAAQPVLTLLAGGVWERAHSLSDEKLTELRRNAEKNLGRAVADLSLQFNLTLPKAIDAAAAIDALNALACVEIALPMPIPAPLPTPPSYQSNQGYLNPAPTGVDAAAMWAQPGGTGSGVKIADLEYSWNLSHLDLPTVSLIGPSPVDPFSDNNHGAAVLGELSGRNNGWGVTGIAHAATMYVVATNTSTGWDVGAAVTRAVAVLSPGDVILIEQQFAGPNWPGGSSQVGLIPVDWYQPWYNAIVTAVGNGRIVVEAAGNGSQNLDDAVYNTGHKPFTAQGDSGAIIVGAGAAPAAFSGSTTDRSRLSFSNYGSTVDLQGWGERVTTTGYGYLYSSEGVNQYYTSTFNGTSSASPIVAGACALLESAHKAATGSVLTPGQVKQLLQSTGSAQQSGAYPVTQNIGPRPNVSAAIAAVLSTVPIIAAIADSSTPAPISYTGPMPTLTQGSPPVSWSLVAKPAGMTINAATGVVSWPHASALGSPHTITIQAANYAGVDTETWLLTVIPVPGDADRDGDVDHSDLVALTSCLSGSGISPSVGCAPEDLDLDNDVDLSDLGRVQRCLTAPAVFADPHCAN